MTVEYFSHGKKSDKMPSREPLFVRKRGGVASVVLLHAREHDEVLPRPFVWRICDTVPYRLSHMAENDMPCLLGAPVCEKMGENE